LITYQKAFHIWKSLYLYSNRNVINKIFPQWITQNLFLENKSVTCIKDKEKNDKKLVDTCNFNARNVNENIEPLLIEQPLLNTNSTEDACICTNNTVVNIDLNESTDIVENVYNESVSENESTCSESIDTNNLNVLCLNCCGLKKKTRYTEFENLV
jgi:hypothetical protein